MALDVEIPDPPPLRGPQGRGEYEAIDMTDREPDDDYRREEVEAVLRDGAWADAFDEWAGHTLLSEADFAVVEALGLIDEFDFYWDPSTDDVGYRAPSVPPDAGDEFDGVDPSEVESELDSLGRVVTETLENDYLVRDEETFGFFADEYTGDESPGE